jgi:hypothetical protein
MSIGSGIAPQVMSCLLLPVRQADSPAFRWAGSSNVGPISVHAVAHQADDARPTASTQATSNHLLRASADISTSVNEGPGGGRRIRLSGMRYPTGGDFRKTDPKFRGGIWFRRAAALDSIQNKASTRTAGQTAVEPFPDDIRRFVDGNVESIDQLEILRVLGEDPAREWDAAGLAAAVQGSPTTVAADAAALHARGLIAAERRSMNAVVYRHGARDPDLAARLGRLLQLYRERPVTMIRLVYDRAKDPLRSFADAFRLRKDKEGG